MQPKLFSFFSGSGFLDLGFETTGFEIVFVNEYKASFLNAYQYSRERMGINKPILGYSNESIQEYLDGDKKDWLKKEIKKAGYPIGFIGGPPCPDFSIGGKNRGHTGDNGKLSGTYIELITKNKPDFFLFENVKGLWKTKRHREFFEELKQQTHNSGYVTTEHLVNSIEFGVPQDRDRILLFGVRKDKIKKGKTIELFNWDKYKIYDRVKIFNLSWPGANFQNDNIQETLPRELTVQYWFDKNEVKTHPNANDVFKPRAGLAKFQTIEEGDVSKKSYKRLHRNRFSPTACYGNNEVHIHPTEPRRITAAEALSIQSLPKEFVLPPEMSLTDKFKTIGNGVPYLLSKAIAQSILDFLNECLEEIK
jgi:DNA (cytosine-5)-methyltransferase 1